MVFILVLKIGEERQKSNDIGSPQCHLILKKEIIRMIIILERNFLTKISSSFLVGRHENASKNGIRIFIVLI